MHVHVGHEVYDDLDELENEYDPVIFPDEDLWFRESAEAEPVRAQVRALAQRLLAEG